MREPQIHSHVTDTLPDNHPLAWVWVMCDNSCSILLHSPNECMTTWVETGKGNFCLPCFVELVREEGKYPCKAWEVLEDEWGLSDES